MSVDTANIGKVLDEYRATISRDRLVKFADAIGETEAVYRDADAARAAGHTDLPIPPTFLFSLQFEQPEPFAWVADLGVDMNHVLHGQQRFTYNRTAYANEELIVAPRIADISEKSNGAMTVILLESTVRDSSGDTVAELETTTIVRNPRK